MLFFLTLVWHGLWRPDQNGRRRGTPLWPDRVGRPPIMDRPYRARVSRAAVFILAVVAPLAVWHADAREDDSVARCRRTYRSHGD